MVRAPYRHQNLPQGAQPTRVSTSVAGRRALPNLNQMAGIPQKPAAPNTAPIACLGLDIPLLDHAGKQRRKIDARIAGQRKRMPEAPVYLHKYRWVLMFLPVFDHRDTMPA